MTHPIRFISLLVLVAAMASCSTMNRTTLSKRSAKPNLKNTHKKHAELSFIEDIPDTRNNRVATPETKINPVIRDAEKTRVKKIPATDYQKQFSSYLELPAEDVMKNENIWFFIDRWWGTPYRLGGTDFNGIDCSSFTQHFYADVYKTSTLPRTAQEQYNYSRIIKDTKKLQPGDLVFFKIRSRSVSHVGVYLQNDKFVNASTSSGVSIGDLNNPYWKRYFVGGGRPQSGPLTGK